MIGYLTGKLRSKTETTAIIDVSGVGYEVFVPKSLLKKIHPMGETISLEIHTHVTETALQLYGFASSKDKMIFQQLISVSGIGPRLALSIISEIPFERLIGAILNGDVSVLTQISGVGKKTAERIVIDLKDKIKDHRHPANPNAVANDNAGEDRRLKDVASALISLGYPEPHAKKVVNGLEVTDEDTVQTLIKKSLALMNNRNYY